MVDSSNDLGLWMSSRKTRAAGEASGGTRARRGILSRFLAALPVDLSFSHNKLAWSGYSGARRGKIIVLSPARTLLRDEEPTGKDGIERLLIFAGCSFLLVRNSTQSSNWDQYRAHRTFVYRLLLKLTFTGQELLRRPAVHFPRQETRTLLSYSLHRRAKGEPDTGAVRHSRESDHS